MAGASLLAKSIGYIGGDAFNVIDILVTKNIVAVRDEDTNQAQNMFLGASKNLDIQAGEMMSLWMGSSNSMHMYDDSSNASLKVNTNATTTTMSGASKHFVLRTDDNAQYSVTVADTEFSQSNNFQLLRTTMSNGFYMDDSLLIDGHASVHDSMSVGTNITCGSNVFSQNYNLYKYNTSNERDATLTGYAFTINSNDQLELLKYTSFSNGAKISKRVGLFGISKFIGNESSDTSYASFDVIGAVTTGSGGISYSSGNNSGTNSSSLFNISGSNMYFTTNSNLDSGAIGIGTSNPQYKLDVDGEIRATGDITAFSDARVKTDFAVIENAMDKVRAINGYTFNKLGNSDRRYAGIIAQELQKVHPEVVSVDMEGMMSVAYGNMAGLFIQALHELDEQIKEIKVQLAGV